jgi:hypothetical protein
MNSIEGPFDKVDPHGFIHPPSQTTAEDGQPWSLWYLRRNPPKHPSAFLHGLIHPPSQTTAEDGHPWLPA